MATNSVFVAFGKNFLGSAPKWYKLTILSFLVLNPILLWAFGPFVTGWVIIGEFIFTLAAALKCYPLPSGGLLAIQVVVLGLTSTKNIFHEVANNLEVILLLMFMVAGIHFMKEGLQLLFTKVVTTVRSKVLLSMIFCFLGAFLSAFLDALTVTAVIIAVAYGFYTIYDGYRKEHKITNAAEQKDFENFQGFLRNLMMHGAVGTALGGALTLVGEPQNLLIGGVMGWDFKKFFLMSAPVSIPVFFTGMATCFALEKFNVAGYGYKMPQSILTVLDNHVKKQMSQIDAEMKARLIVQAAVGVFLVLALAFHLAAVGLVGLAVIIFLTSLNGVVEEHHFGDAFKDALPFTALLVVFFAIVAMIHDNDLFKPILHLVLSVEGHKQLVAFFMANGILSAISDNVFVATVYITEVQKAFQAGMFDQEWFNKLAVAVNMGTNIPSVATPNGQAAFLFLLTSALAPLIRLSYMQMVKLALPYAVTMVIAGLAATMFLL